MAQRGNALPPRSDAGRYAGGEVSVMVGAMTRTYL